VGAVGVTDAPALLRNRLAKNIRRLKPWANKAGISCFRVYDRDMPQVPLALDLYEEHLVAHVYEPRHGIAQSEVDRLIDAARDVLAIPAEHTHVKRRARATGGTAYASAGADPFVNVKEAGQTLLLQLDAHIDVGLFLDHRQTRARVRQEARGLRVLNLFAYTASFSVQAAAGGALSTTSVDLQPATCRWAEANLAANGLRAPAHRVIEADARSFLARTSEIWDLAVIDPPTVSKSKRAEEDFDVQRDHVELIEATLARLSAAGVVYFSTNFTSFELAALRGARAKEITHETVPPDFTHRPPPHRCWRVERARK
jgi:23S rRNA G2069 N7-methylase RlmK/C1962 C5-methylase RlmI